MNYCDTLYTVSAEVLDRTVFAELETSRALTYRELQHDVQKWVRFFKRHGVKQGDCIAIHLHNGINFILTHMAAQCMGAVSALLDPLSQPKSLSYYLMLTDAKAMVTHLRESQLEAAETGTAIVIREEELPNDSPSESGVAESFNSDELQIFDWPIDATSYIYFTSGTTSLPKGVPLTYGNHSNFFRIAQKYWTPSDATAKHISFVPFSHGFGSIFLIPWTIRTQSECYILRGFHPMKVEQAIQNYGITHIYGVPSHYQQLLKFKPFHASLKKLQMAFCAAAKLDKETVDEWKNITGNPLHEGYGLIETTGGIVWRVHQDAAQTGDVGPCPDSELIEVAIMDEDGLLLEVEQEGEIVVRGKSVTSGYLNMPEENARVFAGGWFHTGDKGKMTSNRQLIMTGRIKDIINIAGIKISPFEVESVLNRHPQVNTSAVVSAADPLYGEVVKAFVIPVSGESPEPRAIIKYCAEHLINFQVPRQVVLMDDFPLNNMGKVDRKKLRTL
ncbi:MAG: acyl--CoA ligase [Deltaproteobacteria bacterium]|nr:acyl--CoA ligase [Deltaproteobacteria bacterium]